MFKPFVSVIIPTYNRAEYLKQAIESVLAQTYTYFELLILDNCSPDHTPEVVAQFSDPRIKYLRHQCNIGSSASYTYGVRWSQGEYLSFLGDDDQYYPMFLENRVNRVIRYPELSVVFSGHRILTEKGEVLKSASKFDKMDTILRGKDLLTCAVTGLWHIGTGLYNTKIVNQLWDRILRSGKAGDTALNILIAINKDNSGLRLNTDDLLYRNHPNQDSLLGGEQVLIDCIRAHKEPLESGEGLEYKSILNKGVAWANNLLGRRAWDLGKVSMARRYFIRELLADPFRFLTWLRLIRSFVIRPKSIHID